MPRVTFIVSAIVVISGSSAFAADHELLVPRRGFDAFHRGLGLEGITRIVSLSHATCTHRAAQAFCAAHQTVGRSLDIVPATSFHIAAYAIRNDRQAAMLVPRLHPMQRTLSQKSHYVELPYQGFRLPNPGLWIASPKRNTSDRTPLFVQPALLPLVHRAYPDGLPYEEVVPVRDTQSAANSCTIFGGGFCATNDQGLERFNLRPVTKLEHIDMPWFLYRKRQPQ